MREIVYEFHRLGGYHTADSTRFGDDTQLKIVVKPHDFSLSLGGDTLRKSTCAGYEIQVSNKGGAAFYDDAQTLLASVPEQERSFRAVILCWQQDTLTLQFGETVTVDNYPNCDGESDRWSEQWVSRYEITFSTAVNQLQERH